MTGPTKAVLDRMSVKLAELEQENRRWLESQVRIERRVIHGVEVDVKVCPAAEAIGDVVGRKSMAQLVREGL